MKNKIYNTKIAYMIIGLFTLLPSVVGAEPKTLKTMATLVTEYLNIGLMLIISLAVVVFVWNVFIYFFTEKDHKEAGMYVMYSVIGFFIIFSFWGLVQVLRNSLQLEDQAPPSFTAGFQPSTGIQTPVQGSPAGGLAAPYNKPQ